MIYKLPPRQTFDIVYDKLKEILSLYRDGMPKSYQFEITRDSYRAIANFTGRGVFMHWAGNSDYKNNRGQYEYTAKYYFDCISAMAGEQASSEYKTAGEMTAESNRFLVTQVFDMLTHYVHDNFGFSVGTVGNRRIYIEQVDPASVETERPVAISRVVLDVTMSDTPVTDEGVDLDSILITQSQKPAWALLVEYQEVE